MSAAEKVTIFCVVFNEALAVPSIAVEKFSTRADAAEDSTPSAEMRCQQFPRASRNLARPDRH
ncbi:MAG: hypothetical protein LBS59_01175 [Puniceicoccales bacterium]|jgi:hypothetical protein|nr:hypothetical protein [Puniceicoccales bacterium]